MSKTYFDVHGGHLHARANAIAERHGGAHVNIIDAGRRRGWFEVPSCGDFIDKQRIALIRRDIAAAGGMEALMHKRDRSPRGFRAA